MFLLIRKKNNNSYHNTTALNSIMFLLIPEGHLNCFNWKAHFKFHYVSINSEFEKFFDQYMNEL